MSSTKIKLNSDKASQFPPRPYIPPLDICSASISARNIGVSFDSATNFEFQACSICIPAGIRMYLIARSFFHVTCRLDSGNALLCRLPRNLIANLHAAINCAARVIMIKRSMMM